MINTEIVEMEIKEGITDSELLTIADKLETEFHKLRKDISILNFLKEKRA